MAIGWAAVDGVVESLGSDQVWFVSGAALAAERSVAALGRPTSPPVPSDALGLEAEAMSGIRLGVDIGGTFTDVACLGEDGVLRIAKVLTTPDHPDQGVNSGIAEVLDDLSEVTSFVHGTTLVINALLERKCCRTALVTTKGFRDVLELGRGNRPQAFNLTYRRLPPLIARDLRFEIDERIDGSGAILRPPDLDDVDALADELHAAGVEAVAVAFVNAYVEPVNEQIVADRLRSRLPGVFVGTSTDVSGQWREYERFNSAAANASVGPLTDRYIGDIESSLDRMRFRGSFMLLDSAGGALHPKVARKVPLRLIESGPVGGVLGALEVASRLNLGNLVTFDMGGTTAKSATIEDGAVKEMDVYYVGGYDVGLPMQVPSIDVFEVGAGGGSLAWLAGDGELSVGPRSAGAWPGPACYGRGGTEPTVTDANLVCGRLVPEVFKAKISISAALAHRAVGQVASAAGTSVERMAAGVVELANAAMADMVRRQTIEIGRDPQDFCLLAMGGAGPSHAADVARAVGIRRVVIPPSPGHFSAMGMLSARCRLDRRQGWVRTLGELRAQELDEVLTRLQNELVGQFEELTGARSTAAGSWLERKRRVSVRYSGQEHTLAIDLPPPDAHVAGAAAEIVRARFEAEYERRFGRLDERSDIEITEVQVVAWLTEPDVETNPHRPAPADNEQFEVDLLVDGGHRRTRAVVRSRASLVPEERVAGPAVVYEEGANTFVPTDAKLFVDDAGFAYIDL